MIIDLSYVLLLLSYIFLAVIVVMILLDRRKQEKISANLHETQNRQMVMAEKMDLLSAELQTNKENNKTILALLSDLGKAAKTAHKADLEAVSSEVRILQNIVGQLSKTRAVGGGIASTMTKSGQTQAVPPAKEPVIRTDYSAEKILEIIQSGLRSDRVDLYIQPIVSLPQRKIRHFECLSRLRDEDGAIILPEQFVGIAESAGLIGAVDNLLLFRCIQLVRRANINNFHGSFFCNLSKHTLHDGHFFEDFLEFIKENKELATRLVFEINQADFNENDINRDGLMKLKLLVDAGCNIALSSITNLKLDFPVLNMCRFKYIKVDANVLLSALNGTPPLDWIIFRRLVENYEMDLIIERIEDEELLVQLLEYDLDFGQGYLFGEPRLSKN